MWQTYSMMDAWMKGKHMAPKIKIPVRTHSTMHKRSDINWNSWYGVDDEEEVENKPRSFSSFWRSRWERDDDDPIAPDGSERPEAYMRHLRSLRNVCTMAFGRGNVTVDWATEDLSATDIENGHIVLSPRPLKDRSLQYNEWSIGERLDVLFGRALHEGAHNAYTPAQSKTIAMKNGGMMMAELFNVMEDAYIETEIMEEFPGFSGYFDRKADFDFTPDEITKRLLELKGCDLTRIPEPKTPDEIAAVEKQLTAFVNVMIPACKSRNEVDLSELYLAGGRTAQIAEGIDKIVSNFRDCENTGLHLDERMDASRNAYRVICNLFSKPIAENEKGTPFSFALNGKSDGAIMQMFRNAGVGASSGTTPSAEGSDASSPSAGAMNTISGAAAAMVNSLMTANLREQELEVFHSGSTGTLHSKARIIDMHRKDYADVRYAKMREMFRKHEQRLKLSLQFRSADRTYTERERPFGKIDATRMYQLKAFKSKDIFQRQITTSAPAAHVGILLDESGSMHEHISGAKMSKDETACAAGIMLEAALRGSKSISYEMWGHTGDIGGWRSTNPRSLGEERTCPVGGLRWEGPLLMRYLDSKQGLVDPRVLGRVVARSQNYDGYALEVVYKSMLENSQDAHRRVLMIVCDGMPSGSGYHGDGAKRHVTQVVSKARKSGVEVIAIFVGRLGEAMHQMNEMYGMENRDWIHVPQPDDLPGAVERIAKRVLHWDGGAA
jgi:hypothetical protein